MATDKEFSGHPLFLMDGTAFIYRAFHAQKHLMRSDGFLTNALVVVTRLLLKILREEQPEYFLFVMDGRGRNFRKDIYPEYKANRQRMPEELAAQLEPIKSMVQALGISVKVAEDHEADDCIASLAARYGSEKQVVIISGDKDLKQCLGPDVVMWDPGTGRILTEADFTAETGVSPAQWPDVQALIGDSSDNIPGVPGIGPKTAQQIFRIFSSLEDIRDHIDSADAKIQAKLKPHLRDMFRWRELTTLLRDQDRDVTLEQMKVRPVNLAEAESIAREFEMPTIARDIATYAQAGEEAVSPQESPIVLQPVRILEEEGDLPELENATVAVIWPEGRREFPRVAVSGEEWEWRGSEAALVKWLRGATTIVVEDVKALATPVWQELLWSRSPDGWMDLGLAAYLCDPESGAYTWDKLAVRFRELAGTLSPALLALAIGEQLGTQLKANGLDKLYRQVELPLAPVLARMEATGFAIDQKRFASFLQDVDRDAEALAQEVYREAGEEFNLRSAQKTGEILFGKLGLAVSRKTRGGQPSTSQLALEKLAAEYPVVEHLLQYRKLDKMRATYLEPLPRLVDADGRIHTTFNQKATATGRISSSNPNLQNIPVRGDLGARMRRCFVAAPGKSLAAADYSQIELRVLAHLSQDPTLLRAFREGEDIHSATASLILDVPPDQVAPDQRRLAKTINFGLLYGMGAQKLAQELKISLKEAREFIDRYFSRLEALKKFYEKIVAGAREKGYVTTMGGRRRWLPGINSANGQIAAQAERQAVNAVIQGTAADIIKMAMIKAGNDKILQDLGARMLLQVHDELLLEAPTENIQKACDRLLEIMESIHPGGEPLSVPLVVEGGTGENWGEAH